jgi:hypothetical protein
MGYVKTGMGGVLDDLRAKYSTSSVQVEYESGTAPKVVTDEVAAALAEEQAYLASLEKCVQVKYNPQTGKNEPVIPPTVETWKYTNPQGQSYCTRDPLFARACDTPGVTEYKGRRCVRATSTMPLWDDNPQRPPTITGIREGYLDKLVAAQGNDAGRKQATDMKVSWDLREFGFKDPWNQKDPPLKIEGGSEARIAKLAIKRYLNEAIKAYDWFSMDKAKADPEFEKTLRSFLAIGAHNFAAFDLAKVRADKASGVNTAEHRSSELAKMCTGFPPQFMECCTAYAQQRGMTAEKIREAFNKGEFNNCMAQSAADQQAAADARNRKNLMLAAGGVGAVLLVASILKKKGRK